MKDIYFSHDVGAFTDPKIRKLRGKYGVAGYGVYWAILEALRREDTLALDYDPELFDAMTDEFKTDFGIQQFIDDCARWGLFEIDIDSSVFWSPALVRRTEATMQKNEDLSKKRAEAARRRWNKGNGNAEQNPAPEDPSEPVVESSDMQSDASAMQMHSNDMQSDASKKKKKNISSYSESSCAGAREGGSADQEAVVPVAAYCKQVGMDLTPGHYEQIREFYDAGMTDDMLCFAVDEAFANGKAGFAYVRRVVDTWITEGHRSLEDVKRSQERKRAGSSGNGNAARASAPIRSAPADPPAPQPRFFSEGWNKQ